MALPAGTSPLIIYDQDKAKLEAMLHSSLLNEPFREDVRRKLQELNGGSGGVSTTDYEGLVREARNAPAPLNKQDIELTPEVVDEIVRRADLNIDEASTIPEERLHLLRIIREYLTLLQKNGVTLTRDEIDRIIESPVTPTHPGDPRLAFLGKSVNERREIRFAKSKLVNMTMDEIMTASANEIRDTLRDLAKIETPPGDVSGAASAFYRVIFEEETGKRALFFGILLMGGALVAGLFRL